MVQRHKLFIGIFLLVTVLIPISGCEKVTIGNCHKIHIGMDYKEVKRILGDPTGCESALGARHCVWKSNNKKIEINTIADKVIAHSSSNL